MERAFIREEACIRIYMVVRDMQLQPYYVIRCGQSFLNQIVMNLSFGPFCSVCFSNQIILFD